MFAELLGLARLSAGLHAFLREPVSVAQAEAIIRRRLLTREQSFLKLVERAAGPQRSPYRQLLQVAGCELGDLQALVSQAGVEGALETLRRCGVCVSFEEFKGRQPAVRG